MRIRSVRLLALAALALGAGAEPASAEEWIADPISGCALWADDADPEREVATWSGACEKDKASGEGVLVWFKDGQLLGRYEGGMKGGKLSGRAVLFLRNR